MSKPPTSVRARIPEASLRRLPIYYHLLQSMLASGVANVSCTRIADALQLDPTQVRKDLEATGMVGKPKVGYSLDQLVCWIEQFLGWHQVNQAVLVGTGSLGTALLGYKKFRELGFHLVAAFDIDPAKIGTTIADTEVFPMDRLHEHCRQTGVLLGVIATPSAEAQKTADVLVEAGIRAIWNFAPVHLRVPKSVVLQNEDLYHSLAFLSFRLERLMAAERDSLVPAPMPAQSPREIPPLPPVEPAQ